MNKEAGEAREPRCKVAVYKRDTYRRTGRGKSGFEMHYEKDQCSRATVVDGRCKQHSIERFPNATLLDWHEFIEKEDK